MDKFYDETIDMRLSESLSLKNIQVKILSWFGQVSHWIKSFCAKKQVVQPQIQPQPARRPVDTDAIRVRIKTQGWTLKELPIRRTTVDSKEKQITQWKIIAFRGEKSIETSGSTIDEAIKNIGITLGVISRGG